MKTFAFLTAILSGLAAPLACSADYYIDPAGNDSASGTSEATAWKTLAKVNAAAAPIQPTSPNGKLVLGLSTADSGTFGQSLAGHGTPLIAHSTLGPDFGRAGKAPASGWQIADTKTRSVDSTQKPLFGRHPSHPSWRRTA